MITSKIAPVKNFFIFFLITIFLGSFNLNAQGALDLSFDPALGANGSIRCAAIQSDGKVLIGGSFSSFNGTSINHLARLNADGSLDNTFQVGTGPTGDVYDIAIQSNGKILIAGVFQSYNGTTQYHIARLNTDGTIDNSFAVNSTGVGNPVYTIEVQPDDKILIGGVFGSVNNIGRNRVARLLADGSVDQTFGSNNGPTSDVYDIIYLPDGKYMVCGAFSAWQKPDNNYVNTHIVRLDANGIYDPTFSSANAPNTLMHQMKVQSDGKILAFGAFTNIGNRIVRYNTDGSIDNTFSIGTGANNQILTGALQSDGKILIAGLFTSFNGTTRNRIARLNSDGTLDTSFDPCAGASGSLPNAGNIEIIYELHLQSNGKIIACGSFTTYGTSARKGIARILVSPKQSTLNSITPNAVNVGQTVIIEGEDLTGASSVSFNGVSASTFSVTNCTSLTATVPAGVSSGNLTVTNSDGTSNAIPFVVALPAPTITSFTPASAPVGAVVTITGTNFDASNTSNLVYFGGVRAIPTAATATSLTVTVPTGAVSGKITVLNTAGALQRVSSKDFIVSYANPITVTPSLIQKGTFSLSSSISLSSNQVVVHSMNVAIADFNNDGKNDILLPGNTAGGQLFINTSSGPNNYSFNTPISLSCDGTSDYTMIATGDFDNDGRIDAVIGSSSNVYIHLNKVVNGQMTFIGTQLAFSGISRLRVGDINNDGKLDLLGAGNFTSTVIGMINTSISSLSFSATQTLATGSTYSRSFAVGDMNNDGFLDLMLARDGSVSSPDQTKVFINNGLNGLVGFTSYDATNFSGTADAYAYTLDVNGDGNNDLLMGRGNYNNMFIYQNSYNGSAFSGSNLSTYTWLQPQWGGPTTRNNSFGDLNGDGKVDLVQGGSSNSYIFLNATSPLGSSYAYTTLVKTIANPIITAVADFDLNGINDVFYLDPALGNGSFHELSTVGITVTNTGTAFYACPGGYDAQVKTMTINATNISADVIVTAPTGFQVSSDQTNWSSAVTIAFGNGTLTNAAVYYRSASSNTTGLGGNITIASGGITYATVALTSTVVPAPVNPATITGPATATVMNTNSYSHSVSGGIWSVSNSNLASINSTGDLTVTGSGTLNVLNDYVENNCTYQSAYAINTIYTSVSASPSSLSGFAACEGVSSSNQTISVDGFGLSSDISISAPIGFEISLAPSSGFSTALTLTESGGIVAATTIYVRLSASAAAGAANGNLTITSTGATTQNVALTGTVDAYPNLIITDPAVQCTVGGTVDITAAAVTASSTGGTITSLSYYTNSAATTVLNTPSAVTTIGTYYIVGSTVAGCKDTAAVNVNINTGSITSVVLALDDQPCGATATGSATVTITGGTAPYTYSWTKGGVSFNALPANAPTNLTGGSGTANQYIVTVTDACSNTLASNAINLTNSAALTLTNVSQTANIVCNGATTGAITGLITGGGTAARVLTVTNTTTNQAYSSQTPVSGTAVSGYTYTVSNLPAGTYTIEASSTVSSCTASASNVIINQPNPLAVSLSGTAALCSGVTTGSVDAAASNGTSPYTYAWTATNGGSVTGQSTSEDLASVLPGTYSVVVSDACTSSTGQTATATFTIATNNVTAGTVAGDETICSGGNPAAFTVSTASTGTGTLSYQWQSSTDNSTFTDISGATTDVYDAPNGLTTTTYYRRIVTSTLNSVACTAESNVLTVTVNAISATISASQTICSGGDPAAFTVTTTSASGAALTYLWESSTDGTTWTSTGVTTATYDVASGLTQTTQYRRVTTSVLNGVTCTNTSTAVTVTVNDVTAGTVAGAETICSGGNPTAFTVATAATGTGTLSYQWQSSTDNSTFTDISGATADVYDVPNGLTTTTYYRRIVTSTLNSVACTATSNVLTVTVNAISATISASQTICSGGDPVAFTAATTSTNGAALTYAWESSTDGTTWSVLAGEVSATYDVPTGLTQTTQYRRLTTSVLNSLTCIHESSAVIISVNDVTAGTVAGNETICSGGNPTAFTVATAATGTGTLSYQWQSSTDNSTFTDISGATADVYDAPNGLTTTTYYRRIVTSTLNSVACTATSNILTITINNVTAGTVAASQTICSGGDPSAFTVTVASTGSGTLSYQWQSSTDNNSFTNISGATSDVYDAPNGLTTTTYYRRIVTSTLNGVTCTATSNVLTVSVNILSSTIAASQTICYGGNPVAFTETTTSISGATLSYTWESSINNGASWSTVASVTTPTYDVPNGLTTSTQYRQIVSALLNGLTCTSTSNVVLVSVLPQIVISDEGISDASCANLSDGAIPIGVSGGTGAYSFAWTGPNGFTSTDEDQNYTLAPGTYSVTVTDANSCTATLSNLVVSSPPAITFSLSSVNASCYGATDGSISATIGGGTSPYLFQWIKDGANYSNVVNTLSNIGSGVYSVTVSDANLCSFTSQNVTITEPAQLTATVSGAAASICSGENAVFTITGTANHVVTYQINGGSNVTATIGSGGTVAVTLNAVSADQTFTMVSVSDGSCTNNYSGTATVVVNSLPSASAGTDQTVCAGASVTLAGTGGVSYAWDNSVVDNTAFTATNNTNANVTTTYTLTITDANGCTATDQVDVTVKPIPTVDAITSQAICSNSSTAVTFTSSLGVAGTSYSWTNDTPSIGLAATGQGDISSFTAVNNTTAPVVSTIVVTPSANGCTGSTETFTITVQPTPTVDQQANITYCGGVAQPSITFTGSTPGTQYAFNSTQHVGFFFSGIANPTIGGYHINPSVQTVSTVTVTPQIIAGAQTCSGSNMTFTVTVNPTPTVNALTAQSLCTGASTTALTFSGSQGSAVYNWTNDNTSIGLVASGTGDISSFVGTNTGSTVQTATITVTPVLGSCSGTPATTTIAVYPTPTVTDPSDVVVCAGETATEVAFSGAVTGTLYTWTNNTPSIGLAASGYGTVPAFTATNATTSPVTATVTVTPSFTACPGTPQTFTYTVNPVPVYSNQTASVCSGNALSVTPTGTTVPAGTQFTWTVVDNANVTGEAANSTAASTFTANLTNTTNTAQTVVYTLTPISGACNGATFTLTVTVDPMPSIATQTATICSGSTFTVAPANGSGNIVPSGTTYTWSAPSVTGITGTVSGSSASNISGTLVNTTNAPIDVTYTVTPTAGSCSGTPFTVTVTVNPMPTIASTTANTCSGTGFTVTPTNGTDIVPSNTTYSWTFVDNANITGEANGTSQSAISQTLTNTTINAEQVVYTVTPTAGSCTGSTFTVTATINPTPVVQNTTTTICSGAAFTVAPAHGNGNVIPSGTQYTWTVSSNANISGASDVSTPQASVSQTLTNTTNTVQTITYTVTPVLPGCNGNTFTVVVTVNPTPVVQNVSETICSGSAFTVAPVNGGGNIIPSGTTYTWVVSDNVNILGDASQSVAQSSISHTLVNNYTSDQTVVYTVTPYVGSCAGQTFTATITVNVNPTVAAITGATTVCEGSTTQLASATAGGAWISSNPAVATVSSTGVVTGVAAGTATITYTLTASNGCINSVSASVTVNAGTTATITAGGATTFCDGGSVVLTASAGSSYAWSNGAQTQAITVTAGGSYYVTVTNASGCSATSTATTVTVNPLPTVAAITGATNVCSGLTTQLASATTGGTWSSSNTAVATVSATGVVTGVAAGSATITYTVTNGNGCTNAVTATVNVNAGTTATITAGGATTFCDGGSVVLTASAGSSYAWSNGAQTQAITVTAGGSYYVTVTNASGCSATSTATTVTVNPLPTVAAITGATTVCAGSTTTMASATTGGTWSTSDATVATVSATGVVTGVTAGTATITYTVTNGNGCTNAVTATVNVNAGTTATITAGGATTFCDGGSVTLTASAGSSYAWSNGAQTQAITVTAGGSYYVTVTNASGCSATSTATTVTVNPLPTVAAITGATTVCAGSTTTMASATTGGTWSSSNTAVATVSATGVVTGVTAGTATITYTVTNGNGCTNAVTATVNVNAGTTATITAGGATTFCDGGSVVLTASAGSSYAWSNGAQTQAITVTAGGSYYVTVTNASGCSATSTATTVTVNPLPTVAAITGATTVCAGSTTTMASATTGGTWSSSNTAVATVSATGVVTGVTAGTATITYTVTNGNGCTAAATASVTVNTAATATITAGGATTFCSGGSVVLTASAGTSYAWSNGAQTQAITVTAGGSYYVTVTNASGCSSTSTATVVTVNQTPIAAISSTGSTSCLGSTVTLTATGGVSYAWSNGTATAVNDVTSSDAYTVTVTSAEGCTATATETVVFNVNPAVVVTTNGPTVFCQGGSITLTATGADTYVWNTGDQGSSITVNQAGAYYVTGTNITGCATQSSIVNVSVNTPPVVAAITGSNSVCEGGNIALTSATIGGVWSSANNFIATVDGAGNVTGLNAGTTTMTYTVTNNGCSASASAQVTVLNNPVTPTITASGATSVCPGGSVVLFASNGANYQWSNGPQTPFIVATQSGDYSVTVIGANGCSAVSAPVTVFIGDNTLPLITAPLNVTATPNLGCEAIGVALGTPVTSDNCSVASVTNDAPSIYPIGTTTVTWTVTDASGNTATATQLVTIVDQTAPVATAPANITVAANNFCEATGVDLGTPNATDNCTNNLTITNNAPATYPLGTTTVTWTITDAAGNVTTVDQTVTVVDETAPVVLLASTSVILDANGSATITFQDLDNGSTDNCGIASAILSQSDFDCSNVGNNIVTVTVTDNSGNQTTAQVMVTVIASDACGDSAFGPAVPDAFTPNGNNYNDTWVIPGLEGYNTKEMTVYSRYGTMVHYSSQYNNDWDGTLMNTGTPVPDGTYYYILNLDGGKQLNGYVYINRVKQ